MSNVIANSSYPANFPHGTVIRQPDAVVQSEPDGLASTTEVYRGYYTDMVNSAVLTLSTGGQIGRTYLAPHPDFPSLLAYGVKIKRGRGVLNGTLTIEYRGLDPSLSYPPPPIVTLETTTGNEDIRRNPLFNTDQMAGSDPSNPQNGAQFIDGTGLTNPASPNQTGIFDPTTATFNKWLSGSPFQGWEDYQAPGAILKISYTSYGLPDTSAVGTFSNPPVGGPIPAGCRWFYVGADSEDNAGIYKNSLTYKAIEDSIAADVVYGG